MFLLQQGLNSAFRSSRPGGGRVAKLVSTRPSPGVNATAPVTVSTRQNQALARGRVLTPAGAAAAVG